ncbi:serine hydrolase domain-containing protein [Streptomyces sp. P9(2023)]|uniref:serine hydrolase domain-containing protein n=1 Tax=Streptomyces sp. P9(2023) TaxID=3064394 RepID=UPI0028F43984|nr:serine hydrolase domain-containing protein [Streptomyces sp. P9(2023)]MDT9693198.1 serine hydrolase domain-containing protein [Streptomyces sp. P9(2023)]
MAAADSRVAAAPKAAAGQERPELRETMRALVEAGFAGVQVRVRDERGDWVGSAGVRKLGGSAKPSTDGAFRVGSSTKTFVSTVMLQLVAEGKVGLDAPAADYLPRFELDRRITVRMLLQHTSGLFNFTGEYYPDGTVVPGIPWQGQEWVDKRFHTYQPEELVRFSLARPTRFEPGTDWSYANTNYVLAALLIEQVTGRPYGDEIARRILRPLGLRDTLVPGTAPGIPGPYAHGYHRYQDATGAWKTLDVSRQNPSWISAGGEMISTTEDLATFASALNGGRLLPDHLLAEMRVPHPKSGEHRYGLGLFVQDMGEDCGGGTVFHHNGGVNGYGTLMYSSPDGSRTLTASVTMGDKEIDLVKTFPKLRERLVKEVFCDGPTTN